MGLYGVMKSVGMGCGALWGREVSGNGVWGSMGFQNQWEWGVGFYGVIKSLGLEMGFYGVMKSVGMGCGALWGFEVTGIGDGALWGREVIGNGVWGFMGS